jgi:MFS family permease
VKRVYYGWICVALAALAMVGTLPGRTQGLGLITGPLLADLGLGQTRFAELNLVATLIGALFALPAGWLIDRAGVRLAVPLCEAALGAVVLTMSASTNLWLFATMLTFTRGFGQTALSVASLSTVGKWFSRRISLAMGVYSLALGCGFIAAFPGVQKAAEVYHWRAAWSGVGFALLAAAALSALFLRNHPPPDEPEMRSATAAAAAAPSLTLRQALASPAFWIYGVTSALYLLVASGTSLFTELMLRERGLGTSTFRAALATTALVGIAANFGGGYLGARTSLPRLLAVSTLLLVPCLAAYPYLTQPVHAIIWAAGLGAAGGIVTVVFFAIWADLFGPDHLGKIQGVAQALTVVASAFGPLLFAAVAERTGSYTPAFIGLIPVMLLAGIACWLVRPPRRVSEASS